MIYKEFFMSLDSYFKSVRRIKDYISFDLFLPDTWIVEDEKNIEIVKTDSESGKVTSLVVKYNDENLIKIENYIDKTIKNNLELEEKKKLFNDKVHELRGLFEKSDIENLRSMKFNIDPVIELSSKLENGE